ncbi:MAG: alpha/beta hydrolase [Anaerolineae bacterium]|nr:alpha/beta hydrolase [Anaerolineae bacterium]
MLRSLRLLRLKKQFRKAFFEPLPELPTGSRDPVYGLVEQLRREYQRRRPVQPAHQKSPRELRSDARMQLLVDSQFANPLPPVPEVWHETISANGTDLPMRIYIPKGRGPYPVVVYLHGGGWVSGDLDTAHPAALQIAAKTGWTVVSVQYRLAPEHPFPAALQDACAVLRWCAAPENSQPMRGDPGRIIIAGDGSGANLAAAACLLNRDRQGPPIAYQLLLNPILDLLHFDRPTYSQYRQGHTLTAEDVPFFVRHYIADPVLATDPLVSPLLSANLAGLPAALVAVAEYDVARSDGEEYADRLASFGVPVQRFFAAGMEHGFFDMQHLVPRAGRYGNQILEIVAKSISVPSPNPHPPGGSAGA